MTIRGLIWLALLFAAAVVLALSGRLEAGQVVIVYAPYRIDVSLSFAVAALVVAFIVLYALIRLVRNIAGMPARVGIYRARARAAKSGELLHDALANLHAGRFARAEKAARQAGGVAENRAAAGLIGAQAAHQMREYGRRDEWLARIEGERWREARQFALADMRVEARDADGALQALAELPAQAARRIHAQQIALRAHQQLKHWAEVLRHVRALEKREAIHPAAAARLRQLALENLLRERRHDADALLQFWSGLSAGERQSPRLADLAAELLLALGRPEAARRIVEDALAHDWDGRLLRRYADCASDDALPLIQRAEAWTGAHPDDADLLFALGRLCLRQKLWGKAQSFLEAALAQAGDNEALTIRAHRALARLYEELGQTADAARHYRESALAIRIH
jgi:HemY protein